MYRMRKGRCGYVQLLEGLGDVIGRSLSVCETAKRDEVELERGEVVGEDAQLDGRRLDGPNIRDFVIARAVRASAMLSVGGATRTW
jgi:hypothetical protein